MSKEYFVGASVCKEEVRHVFGWRGYSRVWLRCGESVEITVERYSERPANCLVCLCVQYD